MARKRVKLRQLSAVQKEIADVVKDIEGGAEKAEEAIAEVLAENIHDDARYRTGDLRRSVRVGRGKRGGGVEVHVGGRDAPHAQIVEASFPFIQPNVEAIAVDARRIAIQALAKELD